MNVTLPSFLEGRDQLTGEDVILSQQVASERIHVERMIPRLKCFTILDTIVPDNMFGSINEIVTVCAMLCNLQDPIIAHKALSA